MLLQERKQERKRPQQVGLTFPTAEPTRQEDQGRVTRGAQLSTDSVAVETRPETLETGPVVKTMERSGQQSHLHEQLAACFRAGQDHSGPAKT